MSTSNSERTTALSQCSISYWLENNYAASSFHRYSRKFAPYINGVSRTQSKILFFEHGSGIKPTDCNRRKSEDYP
ncbi:Hypothetical predicted protein [Cloeon dipterum]|uniref:Uncharacterized protein n=1 Tax=Cloeon dipterum TaxID=197152 RepID=A0A8S1DPS1_9INSE|nr:Hypothetical predicted protein [Cloeon dipterum]